jgi:hypothetical protein
MVYPSGKQPARLVSIDVEKSQDGQPALSQEKLSLVSWGDAHGLTLSPDGRYLAMILTYRNLSARVNGSIAQLRVMDTTNYNVAGAVSLDNDSDQVIGSGGLFWSSASQVGLVEVDRLVGPEKTVFRQFNIGQNNALETLTGFEDLVYQVTWSPSGWVVFSAESGLWALDTRHAKDGQAAPAQLNSEVISELDWR